MSRLTLTTKKEVYTVRPTIKIIEISPLTSFTDLLTMLSIDQLEENDMRITSFFGSLSIVTTLFAGGCSYRFCDIGPVCRAEHIFLPKAFTITTNLPAEKLETRPLQATFDYATIEYAGLSLAVELDTSDAFTHQNLGLYVFDTSTWSHTVKLRNVYLGSKPAFPHDGVPSPQNIHFCLSNINYGFGGTLLSVQEKPFTSNLTDLCADFPASDLGAWIDCGDGCPPTASLP